MANLENVVGLENMFILSHKVSIYVPSKQQTGEKVSGRLKQINEVKRELSEMFGGCTTTKAVGNWILNNGKVTAEPVELCYSFAETLDTSHMIKIAQIVQRLKTEMNQERISIEIDGKLYIL